MVSQVKTMQQLAVSADASSFSMMIWGELVSLRMEIMMFVVAVIGYLLLFSSRVPKDLQRLKLKTKNCQPEKSGKEPEEEEEPKNFEEVEASLQRAVSAGDHRSVLKGWNSCKQLGQAPTSVKLSQVVESMQCAKKDALFINRELVAFFKKHTSQCDMTIINDVIESLGKRLDSELMALILDMLPSLGLKQDQRTYEIFLVMHATTRSYPEVQRLVAEMEAGQVEFSNTATLAVIKVALQAGKFEEAQQRFSALKAACDPEQQWAVPRHIMAQLVEAACKENLLQQFLPELKDVPLPEEAIHEMLSECIRLNDSDLARSVETVARSQKESISDSTYSLLIKALAGRPWRAKAVVQEVVKREVAEFSPELAMSVLSFCAKASDNSIADTLLERMQPKQLTVLAAFIRYYIESEQLVKACDVFEHRVQPMGEAGSQGRSMIDSRVERSLMGAALACGRTSLVQALFDPTRVDVAQHILMIRKCAAENNLKGSMSIFDSLKEGGVELNSIIYNTILDACVKCCDLEAAEDWMRQITEAGFADVVSFNTLMKAHLAQNQFGKARSLMDDMKKVGLQPNRVTFNELLNAAVVQGARRSDIWELVKEMKAADIPPNQVTCSILLKTLNAKSVEADVVLTMDLIESLDEPMDEVLLSSTVEACVRIGKPELLVKKLDQMQEKQKIVINGSHTCGSLIKAYGYARDISGAWRCWKEMRARSVKPTCITLGCMIDAVVNNGDTEGAFELLHECQKDEQCRDAVNSILYCSVLKGFAREKKLERVWAVYEEMCKNQMEMSLITFNTIIDACARTGHMDNLAKVQLDMKKHHVDANIVTWSTIIKGHCQAGDVQKGLSVMKDMQSTTKLKPDEIMFNSLLDGCAQNNLYDQGQELLKNMLQSGIAPSNFTLSIMVKMLNRNRKVEQSFALVKEITEQYKFKPNMFVYTNLMQGCISTRQLPRALTVLESMVKDKILPDCRLYSILIRASIYQESYKQADALLRAALGLPGAFELPGVHLPACWQIEASLVNETLTSLAEWGCATSLAAPLLADIKAHKIKVTVDQGLQRRVLTGGPAEAPAAKGKGKGKGKW